MTTDTVGGVWSYATQLSEGLIEQGVAVALAIIGPRANPHQQLWLNEMTDRSDGYFHHDTCEAPLEWMVDNESAYAGAKAFLKRMARTFRATVLHSNQFCFGGLSSSMPRLVVAHSDVLSWAEHCRSEAMEPSCWLDRYISLVTAGLYGADAVVAPSRWMLSALSANFLIPGDSCVIHNGRTLKSVEVAPERALRAVTAGRLWDAAKNLGLLEDVRSPVPILIAGENTFESATASWKKPSARLLGYLAQDALLEIFRQSAIYICCSQYEPFGLAPLEAALCGCAVLAHDIPSLREVWSEGALYFADAASLSELLTMLAYSPGELSAAQQRSHARAQRYSAATMTERYMDLYRNLVSIPGRLCNAS